MSGQHGELNVHRFEMRRVIGAALLMVLVSMMGATAFAQSGDGLPPLPGGTERPADVDDAAWSQDPRNPVYFGRSFPIERFEIGYFEDHPQHAPIESFLDVEFTLIPTDGGYVAATDEFPLPGYAREVHRLGDAFPPGTVFTLHAIQFGVLRAIGERLEAMDLLGGFAAPSPGQIGAANEFPDLRTGAERDVLRIIVLNPLVSAVRTFAYGDRITGDAPLENNPLHDRIRMKSPFQPYQPLADDAGMPLPSNRQDLLRRRELNEYALHLSRHPGRRVDVAVAGAGNTGVELHYMVNENKGLLLYGQVSNTGTKQTDRWRYRLGFLVNQLTNHDDLFSLDYLTAGFDASHALIASYEARLGDLDRTRYRIFGNWSEYTASEVGFANEVFEGRSYGAGAEVVQNFYQNDDLFLDAVLGVQWSHDKVENRVTFTNGETDMVSPYVGVRLERRNDKVDTVGSLTLSWTDGGDVLGMGRLDPDENWTILRWDIAHSFFLEPVLNPAAWADASTPSSSTLAHEIALGFRGQYAFERRLVPQAEQVVGGFYSVRGYPESVAAGDTAYVATAEYRFHLPRIFTPSDPDLARPFFGRPFRWAPQYVYTRPDWDLILRGFVDVGQTIISDPFSFESDNTLVGTGVGIELLLRQNINLRVDWGVALQDLESDNVHAGSNRFHFVATFLY
ncbi:MAG: ShlB/FhaC/HecB family hemolysin secretion/activation protein [Phycisphaerales bacterium]|nr:ShlB/FhaC/HecB family hemolysin secretion/activation protein [Phycisphaerales bacterium]